MGKSLVTKIIFTFVCLCIVPFALLNFLFIQQSRRLTEENMRESLQKLVEEKAQVVSLNLKQVEREAENLSIWLTERLNEPSTGVLLAYYRRDNRGVLGREFSLISGEGQTNLKSISNVYLAKNVPVTPQITHDILTTEKMDTIFDELLKKNPNIEWVYFITNDGLMRVFPYLSNDIFAATHDQRTDPFFIAAGEERNPDRKAVWTKPYYDYAGKGWVVTCSQPVYVGGKLRAVVCLDVSLNTLEQVMADFRFAKSGFAFLLDKEGNIIYHPDYIPSISKQGEILRRNLFELDLSPDYQAIIARMVAGEKDVAKYVQEGQRSHLIAFTPIENLNWSIGIEVNEDDYVLGIDRFAGSFIVVGIILLFVIATFGVYLFIQLSKPILQLTKDVQKIAAGEFGQTVDITSRDEIGILAQSFNTMSEKIKDYTEDIIRKKNQLETVFNGIGGLLLILGPDYRVRMLNKQGLCRLKTSNKEAYGILCYEILAGLSSPCPGCPMEETLNTGKEAYGEVILGKEVYHNWTYPIFNHEGKLEEIVVYSRKVTEQVMLEQELAQAEKLAGIGQLAAGVTHELKNPLAVIKGAAYLLRTCIEQESKEVILEALEEIDANILRAEKIIYNLLDFSRISKNGWEQVEVRGLLEQILLFERQAIVNQRIQVEMDFDPEPLFVVGRADSLKHIFLNIITNAIQAMPTGGKLSIRGRTMGTADQEKTELTFSDTGCGIPFEWQDKIFEPFFTTKETGKGTGLGLWIVRREIEKHGGTITLQSTPGQGASFTVILPAKRKKEEITDEGN